MRGCAELRIIICNSSHDSILATKELGLTLVGLAVLVFLLAWWGTSRLCQRTSKLFLLDHPNSRSLHEVPTPRTGGVAIIGSLFLGLIAARGLGLLVMSEDLLWSGWVDLKIWILSLTML